MNQDELNEQAQRVTHFLEAVTLGDEIESRYAAIQSEFRALLIDIETERRVYKQLKGDKQDGR